MGRVETLGELLESHLMEVAAVMIPQCQEQQLVVGVQYVMS